MHSGIRTSNERLVVGLTDLRRSARHPSAIALQKWFRDYREELRGHHRIEDTIFFPALAARIPSYADYSPTLDTDHHRLDELVDLVSESVEALAAALVAIAEEAARGDEALHEAPATAPIGRLDETNAARHPVLRWQSGT
jgi:iron-sulfur cluster repair protein YtfE (RIC family)